VSSKSEAVAKLRAPIQTVGQMRTYLANCMLAVGQGDLSVQQGAVIKGLGDTINDSLYSEIKTAALMATVGKESPKIGDLGITGSDEK